MREKELLKIVNSILQKRDAVSLNCLENSYSLRKDLGFDSFDLAELTVLIEDKFEIDIFENGLIDTIEEILDKLGRENEN